MTEGRTRTPLKDGRNLEEYVKDFVNVSHLAQCNDFALMEGFWVGLDDEMRLVMPRGNSCWTLAKYINFALWVSGSDFTVGETALPESRPTEITHPGSHPAEIAPPEPSVPILVQDPTKLNVIDFFTEPSTLVPSSPEPPSPLVPSSPEPSTLVPSPV